MTQEDGLYALGALAHPVRLEIFQWLVHHEPAFVSLRDIGQFFGLRPASLSSYLAALTRAGLIYAVGVDDDRRYRACIASIAGLAGFLTAGCCKGETDLCNSANDAPAPGCDNEVV